jgi:hypothetical protein
MKVAKKCLLGRRTHLWQNFKQDIRIPLARIPPKSGVQGAVKDVVRGRGSCY